jgi:hypothetical protein
LRVIPNLSIHLGSFLSKKAWMMRADGGGKVKVLKTEEKGSDVNLASYLLIDAYCSDCDVAVIVSNDIPTSSSPSNTSRGTWAR